MCYNQTGDITTLDGIPLKLVDKFTYLGSSVSSTEKDIDTRPTKAWTAIDRLLTLWKSDLTDKMKRRFFQPAVVLILLYGCTTWTLTKWLEKKLDGNYTRMLRAILNKSWWQHPTKHQLYGHLPPITKTIEGHCWRNRDELISDVLRWTPTYGRAKAGRPARIYIQQLCEDTGCSPEDLPEVINDIRVSRWFFTGVSDIKSPQVSRILLSILAVLNNVVVWMVSTRPPTSKFSSPFSNPLVTVPNAPITIGIIVTCMFHSFFNSLARSRYLSFFLHSFSFILWSAGTAKSTILQVLFFFLLLIIIKSGLLAGIR